MLRAVARRIGVSPNAAYRHFADLEDLLDAVTDFALGALARAMEAELDVADMTGDARADAMTELLAVGRGYVHFALAEPGLFASAFRRRRADIGTEGDLGACGLTAADLLQRALDHLSAAGLLADEDREAAVFTAWAGVHGLATLLLGPLGEVPPEAHEAVINANLDLVCRGLLRR